MNAADELARVRLTPLALKDTPALIEAGIPCAEDLVRSPKRAQGRRRTNLDLAGLVLERPQAADSWSAPSWLGSLLPQTGDAELDLDIFEKLNGLGRREPGSAGALANDGLKPRTLRRALIL